MSGSQSWLLGNLDEVNRRHTGEYWERGFRAMVTVKVRQFLCGLQGHDALLHFEHGRLSLQCSSCGYETPGWDLGTSRERPQTVESSQVVAMPLVDQRRVA
jgi:hypothetical protein